MYWYWLVILFLLPQNPKTPKQYWFNLKEDIDDIDSESEHRATTFLFLYWFVELLGLLGIAISCTALTGFLQIEKLEVGLYSSEEYLS